MTVLLSDPSLYTTESKMCYQPYIYITHLERMINGSLPHVFENYFFLNFQKHLFHSSPRKDFLKGLLSYAFFIFLFLRSFRFLD